MAHEFDFPHATSKRFAVLNRMDLGIVLLQDGLCFALCLMWMEKEHRDESYVMGAESTIGQSVYRDVQRLAGLDREGGRRDLLEILASRQAKAMGIVDVSVVQVDPANLILSPPTEGHIFAALVFFWSTGAGNVGHSIALRLRADGSGRLFDPNVGEADYGAGQRLDLDLQSLFRRYVESADSAAVDMVVLVRFVAPPLGA